MLYNYIVNVGDIHARLPCSNQYVFGYIPEKMFEKDHMMIPFKVSLCYNAMQMSAVEMTITSSTLVGYLSICVDTGHSMLKFAQ